MRQDTASHARCRLWIVSLSPAPCCRQLLPLPAFPATPVRQPTSGFQGEIVYVLEGKSVAA
jgi:hypothetical protein